MPVRNLRLLLWLAAAGLLAATGCSTIRSGSHIDETADIPAYEQWSWIADDPHIAPDDSTAFSPLTHAKVRDAIAGQLEVKGYRYDADRSAVDFVVAYTLGSRDKLRVSSYPVAYRGPWGPWGWHVAGSRYYVREYEEHSYSEGTLSVDVFDARTRRPVWHGWAGKTITDSDRRDPDPVIRNGVARLFESFPRSAGYGPEAF